MEVLTVPFPPPALSALHGVKSPSHHIPLEVGQQHVTFQEAYLKEGV